MMSLIHEPCSYWRMNLSRKSLLPRSKESVERSQPSPTLIVTVTSCGQSVKVPTVQQFIFNNLLEHVSWCSDTPELQVLQLQSLYPFSTQEYSSIKPKQAHCQSQRRTSATKQQTSDSQYCPDPPAIPVAASRV